MNSGGSLDAFSVSQCVTKRTRQLERLQYMAESTAAKFHQVKEPPTSTDALLSLKARAQVQKRYGELLLDFLEKERGLDLPALFATALHLEMMKHYDEELQQLLVLVEEEETLRQRIGVIWEFLITANIDLDNVALVRICQSKWSELLPNPSCALPVIATIRAAQGDPDLPLWLRSLLSQPEACSAVHPWPPTFQRNTS